MSSNPTMLASTGTQIPADRTTAPVTTFTAPAARLRGTALAVALVRSLVTASVSHTGIFLAWDSSATGGKILEVTEFHHS
jgi:hypothetical protein